MGQQEQIREVASSMKWVQNIVLYVNDGILNLVFYFKN
jgi:hypothetical protein